MNFDLALNEVYTRDKYKYSKPLDPFYYSDGIDLHVEDTAADYKVIFDETSNGLTIHIVAKGIKSIPKGINLTKKDIPYETEFYDIMDKSFSPKEFYEFCRGPIYKHFSSYINHEAQSKGCTYPGSEERSLNILGRSIYFLKKNGIDFVKFHVTEDEINGIQVSAMKDENSSLHYSEAETPNSITKKQRESENRKVYDLSNIPWNLKQKMQKKH